jgi:hypothetical protein
MGWRDPRVCCALHPAQQYPFWVPKPTLTLRIENNKESRSRSLPCIVAYRRVKASRGLHAWLIETMKLGGGGDGGRSENIWTGSHQYHMATVPLWPSCCELLAPLGLSCTDLLYIHSHLSVIERVSCPLGCGSQWTVKLSETVFIVFVFYGCQTFTEDRKGFWFGVSPRHKGPSL